VVHCHDKQVILRAEAEQHGPNRRRGQVERLPCVLGRLVKSTGEGDAPAAAHGHDRKFQLDLLSDRLDRGAVDRAERRAKRLVRRMISLMLRSSTSTTSGPSKRTASALL
jgi:hypothetical protein